MVWSKSEHNPIISGADRYPIQSYPPTVIPWRGRYLAVTKTEGKDLVGFESSNGIHFSQFQSYILKTDAYAWDSEKLTSPLLREFPHNNELVLYYGGRTSRSQQWVGYAVAGHDGFQKARVNPIITSSEFSSMSGTYNQIYLTDVVRVNDTYYFLGSADGPDGSILWRGCGDSPYSLESIHMMFHADDFASAEILQSPSVILLDGTYILQFTMGHIDNIHDERRLYAMASSKLWNFTGDPVCILPPGPRGSWDERRVYAAQWLKCQDGSFLSPHLSDLGQVFLYYSGHDLGHLDIPSIMKILRVRSLGSVRDIENAPLWELNSRFLITKLRQKVPFLFNYNMGLTGLATYDSDNLLDFIQQY